MDAQAVYLPPDGRDSCVGVTVRLTEGPAPESNPETLGDRITDVEVQAGLDKVSISTCVADFNDARMSLGLGPEPGALALGFAIDPDGLVCAVVEQERMMPLNPGAMSLIDDAARCAKTALFRARFPAGRVKDKERIVLMTYLSLMTEEEGVEGPKVPSEGLESSSPTSLNKNAKGADQ